MEEIDTNIPSTFVERMSCFVGDIQDKAVDVAVCTKDGFLIEFFNKSVVDVFTLKCEIVEQMSWFISYNPVVHYYLLKTKNSLIVICKKKNLEKLKTFEDVKKFEINDYWDAGYPQVGIWTVSNILSEIPDIITDFKSSEEAESKKSSGTFSKLEENIYQEIETRLSVVQQKLAEKREFRVLSSFNACGIHSSRKTNPFDMVTIIGEPTALEEDTSVYRQQPVDIIHCWQRVHHQKWIIGVTFANMNVESISNVDLMIGSNNVPDFEYVTKMYVHQQRELLGVVPEEPVTETNTWKATRDVSPKTNAAILGILKAPDFVLSSTVTLSGCISYKRNDADFQVSLPIFELSAAKFASSDLRPFNCTEFADPDLLSVFGSSETITLIMKEVDPSPLKILVDELKFNELHYSGILYQKGDNNPGLQGILVIIKNILYQSYEMEIYGRNEGQIILFIQCFSNFLPVKAKLGIKSLKKEVSNDAMYSALNEEVNFLSDELSKWNTDQNISKKTVNNKSVFAVPRETYSDFIKTLTSLERKTDKCFESS